MTLSAKDASVKDAQHLPDTFVSDFIMDPEFGEKLKKKAFVCWKMMHSIQQKLSSAKNHKVVCTLESSSLLRPRNSKMNPCNDVDGEILKSAASDLVKMQTMSWEKIHCGKWDKVDFIWRDLYAMTCYGIAGVLLLQNQLEECVRTLDMGIILGANLYQKRLQSFINYVHPKLVATSSSMPFPILIFDEAMNEDIDLKQQHFNSQISDSDLDDRVYLECTVNEPLMMDSNRMISNVDSEDLDLITFITDYFNQKQPVLIKGLVSHWSAIQKWKDLEYLRQSAGFRTVPIEIGSMYTDDEWTQKLMQFQQFIKHFLLNTASTKAEKQEDKGGIGYLAQHLLFEQIQSLKGDISIPDFAHCGSNEDLIDMNCWFGPNGTTTPIHHDPKHNILCQVVGYKYLRIWAPSENDKLYPRNGILNNTSQVDPALDPNVLKEQFPKYQEAQYLDVWLEPGDGLYLPPKWWHYVQSKSISFSVSFWFE